MRYRLIDAPLVRDMIGFGRSLVGLSPLPVDWNWSLDWKTNQQAGALPDPRLLITARFAVASLFPLTLICLFLTGRKLHGPPLGLVAAVLVGINPLVLLHARRAMSEGVLLFCSALFLMTLVRYPRKSWLIGLAVGLALAAKQSTFPFILVGLVGIIWYERSQFIGVRPFLVRICIYFSVLIGVFFLLNPVFWKDPVATGQAMLKTRLDLTTRQEADIQRVDPERALNSPGKRLVAALGQIYLLPPAYEDIANYSIELTPQEFLYQSLPIETSLRGLIWGGFFLIFTLIGLVFAWLRSKQMGRYRQLTIRLFLLAAVIQGSSLAAFVPTAYQRYWIPEIPFICMLEAFGVLSIGWFGKEAFRSWRSTVSYKPT
jgi:4-amino-4-deoxy-L-arabinose transferase-like glycosyltransferase